MKPFLEKAMDPQIVPDNLGGYFNALSGWFDFTMRWSRQKSHDFLGKTWRITRKYASNKTLLHIITTALNIYVYIYTWYIWVYVFPCISIKGTFFKYLQSIPTRLGALTSPPPFSTIQHGRPEIWKKLKLQNKCNIHWLFLLDLGVESQLFSARCSTQPTQRETATPVGFQVVTGPGCPSISGEIIDWINDSNTISATISRHWKWVNYYHYIYIYMGMCQGLFHRCLVGFSPEASCFQR